jgi:AcrR family transcriptional regulator
MSRSILSTQYSAVQSDILHAATRRLIKYGYTKTTMCEIASDLEMSTANLYRHYANKLDILKACAICSLKEELQDVQLIVDEQNESAERKLQDYAMYVSEKTHKLASGDTQILEVLNTATKAYPELIHATNEQHCSLLACIIEQGVTNKEFKRSLKATEISAFHMSLMIFRYPFLVHLYSLAEFQRMAKDSIKLLTVALKSSQ